MGTMWAAPRYGPTSCASRCSPSNSSSFLAAKSISASPRIRRRRRSNSGEDPTSRAARRGGRRRFRETKLQFVKIFTDASMNSNAVVPGSQLCARWFSSTRRRVAAPPPAMASIGAAHTAGETCIRSAYPASLTSLSYVVQMNSPSEAKWSLGFVQEGNWKITCCKAASNRQQEMLHLNENYLETILRTRYE